MNSHDFSELYAVGGPIIEQHIREIIKNDANNANNANDAHIESCINYLHNITDIEYINIYINMDIGQAEYYMNKNKNKNKYCYIDYAIAYISDIKLIQKCLEISKVPLRHIIKILFQYQHNIHINFNVESCKLLYENGCNVTGLLHIACISYDYNSLKYLVNNMLATELFDLVNSREYIYLNLAGLLVIDRIMNMRDRCFTSLLMNVIMETDYNKCGTHWVIKNMTMYYKCYYIIKYMTVDDGKKIMEKINKIYDKRLKKTENDDNNIMTSSVERLVNEVGGENLLAEKLLHNNLLEYHFRPRGSHTKGAVA
jgi:hypothetical protein